LNFAEKEAVTVTFFGSSEFIDTRFAINFTFLAIWKQCRLQNGMYCRPGVPKNELFCFGVLFVDFCVANMKETTNILTSV